VQFRHPIQPEPLGQFPAQVVAGAAQRLEGAFALRLVSGQVQPDAACRRSGDTRTSVMSAAPMRGSSIS
jgi:hypothetical protein